MPADSASNVIVWSDVADKAGSFTVDGVTFPFFTDNPILILFITPYCLKHRLNIDVSRSPADTSMKLTDTDLTTSLL